MSRVKLRVFSKSFVCYKKCYLNEDIETASLLKLDNISTTESDNKSLTHFFYKKVTFLKISANSSAKTLRLSQICRLFFVIWMMKREITYKTENANTIIYVLLHKNDFNILNLSHITSRLTIPVNTV